MENPEEKLRKLFGDTMVDLINESLIRLNIPTDPTKGNHKNLDQMTLLFHIQQMVQTAHKVGMESLDIIAILKEVVTINERIYKNAADAVAKQKKAEHN